jgi:type I restriction enzyme, S subunit
MNNETMMLLERHFDTAFAAPDGIKKLRELILTLAMQGKLVPQDPNDEHASELLKSIESNTRTKIYQSKLVPEIKLNDLPHKLPNTWEWVRLGNIFDLKSGCSFPKEDELESGKYMYLKVGEMNSKGNEIVISFTSIFLDESKKVVNSLIPTNSIIFPKRGGAIATNKKRLVLEPICVDTNIMAIVCPDNVELAFAYHWILSVDLALLNTGTSVPQINNKDISPLLFPFPPLAEQRRIVAEIDRLMARCDELEKLRADRSQKLFTVHTAALNALLKAKDTSDFSTTWSFITQNFSELYSVKENVAQLRKAILQLAVMGKLVPQDPNDEPASELLKSIELEKQKLVTEGKIKQSKPLPKISLKDIPYQLPKGWEWANLQDLLALVTDGDHMAPPKANTGTPFLVIGNLNKGKVTIENCRFVPNDYYESLDWGKKPVTNDILYTVTGSYGIPIFIDSDLEFCVQRHVAIFKSAKSSPVKYLMHLLKSRYAFQYATSVATGIAQKTVPLTGLRQMLIAVPPVKEQQRIVAKIDRLMGMCDRLEESIEAAKGKQTDLLNALMSQV